MENDNKITDDEMELITNQLLEYVRELEFSIQLFIFKSNSANSLRVRRILKEISPLMNDFKKISIGFFKDNE
jgi:hypothetical protein